MFVLIVARGAPSEKYPFHGCFEFGQAKALIKAGCKVVYAVVDIGSMRRWRRWGYYEQKIEGVDVCFFNFPLSRLPRSWYTAIGEAGTDLIFRRVCKKWGRPDVVHSHFLQISQFASVLKQNYSIPLVMTEHWSLLIDNPGDELIEIAAHTYGGADVVVAVSTALASVIQKKTGFEPVVIANMIDPMMFLPALKTRTTEEAFHFMSVGNLVPSKRMDLLIEAFTEEFREMENVFLTIWGDGPEKEKLSKMLMGSRCAPRVKLMGAQLHNRIVEGLLQSDCFVLASRFETFGVAYVEALAMGVPVIATRCGGPEDFVNADNGVMIPVDNKNGLKKAMRYMYINAHLYNKKALRHFARSAFSEEVIAQKIVGIYKQVTKNSF